MLQQPRLYLSLMPPSHRFIGLSHILFEWIFFTICFDKFLPFFCQACNLLFLCLTFYTNFVSDFWAWLWFLFASFFVVFVIASIKSEIYLVDEWFFYFTCGNLIYESEIIFMTTSGHLLRHLIIRKMKNVGWYSFIYLTDCSWCSIHDVEVILTFYWWCFGRVLEDFLESP